MLTFPYVMEVSGAMEEEEEENKRGRGSLLFSSLDTVVGQEQIPQDRLI